MAGYIGSKAVLLSTTAATVTGDAQIGGDLTVDTNTLFVDAANNRVGIGTSSPTGDFNVVDASGNCAVNFTSAAGSITVLGLGDVDDLDNGAIWYSNSDNSMRFYANAGERARIDASGNLLVGTTTAFTTGDVNAGGTGGIYVATAVANEPCLTLKLAGGVGTVARFIRGGVTAPPGSITITNTTTAYNTSSDYRLKTDAQPMTGASDRVLALKPVNFEWISTGERVDGFLAHEAQEVVPEAVTGTKDAVDADGNPVYQGIDQSKLVPLLTAALQEALTEIQDLKARVATLEGGAA
jgi:hypothetical protein